ncbi:MAG: molecular chaperone HtpG [Gammaproteobacteria bacterium RIFCSPHIGHO2_12_FULL_42_10]|nr:MAG: molecular chaperone HtpG [Gammaproteobacteria bacterium RIFCSPHIGHO2_12_FULL_42_10]
MTIEAHQEKLSFQAEVKQLLDIVIHSLYSNKEIFLRELISNASDAIDKLRFEALSDPALNENQSTLTIHVSFDTETRTITIADNGIGMNRDEIMSNLGTIAKSGTRDFLSRLTGDQKSDSHLIGQFGVGFYSAFIVADKVTVKSRRAGLGKEHGVLWESSGDGEYMLANIEKESRGTEITLHLKQDEDDFLNDWRLRSIITKYSDHLGIPIMMPKLTEEGKRTEEWVTVNRATALWMLPKNQVTDDEYKAFYKHISHDFEDPLIWTQHKIEGGSVEYMCLLYIPSHAPFDMFQRDAHHGLKLYVQRVFIMDQLEQFLPNYLRFVRGVLDTTALPLNISREILQDHPMIPKLRAALVRHVLDLLDRLVKDEPEKYKIFWHAFGNVLKEGLAEDFTNRDRLASFLRFTSTTSLDEQSVSLKTYIERMKPTQKKIYYITADNLNAAKSSPHLEVFRKNNIEVLLLTDRIDEWVVGHLTEFEGKSLQSIIKGDLSLDEIESPILDKQEEEKKEKAQQEVFEPLLKKMQSILTKEVQTVRLSHRLIESPVCLVRDQMSMGPQMERLMKAAGQAVPETKPTLELNIDHKIVQQLQHEKDEKKLADWTHLLYEQALLAEGSALPDPAAFVQRLNQLWMLSF